MVYKKTFGEYIFDGFNYVLMVLIMLCMIYPIYYIVVASVSDPMSIYGNGGVLLWPKNFAIDTYGEVLKNAQVWTGYRNTIIYVALGGCLSVLLTVSAAFALTRRGLPGKNVIMMLILFTMYFSGGLIPSYLVVRGLGILDTPLAMILPHAVSTYNLIITITYFRGLPYELEEAAKIDGANDYTVLFRILIPLATPIIAVIALYYMVAIWNNYFTAMLYLNKRSLYPLQLILREILIQNSTASMSAIGVASSASENQAYAENVKYAIIVVATIPIMCIYPFLQRFFAKGVMIGAVKE